MPLAYQDVPARLRQRCCLICGYDGPELQGDIGDETYRCPACDADLYARPPRSYAELEGFQTERRPDPAVALTEVKPPRTGWLSRLFGWLRLSGARRSR